MSRDRTKIVITIKRRVVSIKLPEKLDLYNILPFAKKLDELSQRERLSLDMGDTRWFPPFSLLFISAKLKKFKLENPRCDLLVENYKNHTYPGHMGFFKMFGFEYGLDLGGAAKNKKCIPITCVQGKDLYKSDADKYSDFHDLIQKEADEIASIICREYKGKGELFNVLSYSIREIFRNVFEHSETNELFYCAQFWPTKNKVEVSIADLGIGIRRSLGLNPNFRFKEDKEAIENSLLPGVSGKTQLPRSDGWHNSGYGLYMTSRLARNGGNFVIASGDKAIMLSPNQTSKRNFDTSFFGTALRLNFDVGEIGNVQARLAEFRADGAKIEVKRSGNRPPSAMSLLLRRDFK